MKKGGSVSILVMESLLLFFGCSSKEPVAYQDTINVAITAQPPTLDPATTTSLVALDVANNFLETLYTL